MSRIGLMPIAIPAGVTVDVAENNKVTVKGPKGTLERVLPAEMEITVDGSEILVIIDAIETKTNITNKFIAKKIV